ncbi:hypothetical protein L9F63_000276 [Diploptera punctata]|uniref:Meckelin n=1 Tax=Diploptera punctata TaxID=6984 RepID=A0AAD8ALZ1_DIPPU|nr:hypothetical protein L9F63_000276 [Diploptera punctata]
MNIKNKFVTLFLYLTSVYGFSGEITPYTDPTHCIDNEYFDFHLLKCVTCDESKHLKPTKNRLSCICNSRSKIVQLGTGQFAECEVCPDDEVPTLDKRDCVPCLQQQQYENNTVCVPCNHSQITVDRNYNGNLSEIAQCVNCSTGTIPSSNGKLCEPCLYNCTCPSTTHEYVGGVCVPQSFLSSWPENYIMQYESGEKIESEFLRKNLRLSVYLCKQKNMTACQLVANMCALVMYHDNYPSSPCRLFQDSKHIPTSDSNILPWLYYGEGDAQTVLTRRKISAKYSMDINSPASMLNLTVVRYKPDGHLKGISSASGSFLQLCPESWTSLDMGLRFGTQYHRSCSIPVRQLMSLRETEFLDLYLQYWETSESLLYAIPTLVQNFNRGSDRSQWQLTRRFFMIDTVSGVKVASVSNKQVEESPSVIRYMKSCVLRVKVRGREEGRIYPPLLILKYGEVNQQDIDDNVELSVSFKVEYEMENSMSHSIEVSMGVLSGLAVVWTGIETWSWSRRSGRVGIDLITLAQLMVFACGNLANVFFFVVACASFHMFTFYKGQSVVHVLLSTHQQDVVIRNYIIAAFSLKIVEIIYMISRQVSIDIFFIDWERPRARSSTIHPQSQALPENTEQPVSIWRTYFVANEWNEIQAKRKTSLIFQLLVTVFFLKVVGIENWAVADPDLHTSTPEYMNDSPPSLICRFAVGLCVFLTVYLVQWIFFMAIYERYIKNFIQEFADICSMANVSVFILALENFGFYIHGRSAHGFADTDMQTMLGQLQREEEDLCGHRGLLPGSDQQTFQMAIPMQLRSYYRKVMAPLSSIMQSTKRLSMAGAGGLRNKMMSGNMDRSIQAYHNMNKFLAAFLEHALKDLDYDVREKTFVESLLDIEFTEIFEKGILYSDSGHSFDNVLFYWNEFTLVTFDIILFSFVEILFHDFLLAAVVTAFCAQILVIIRKVGGKRNLAKKTLIDERFLV